MIEPALTTRTRIWDLPTRVFHWSLAGLFCFSWWSAENARMDWHRISGYVLVALLLFRWYWGFAGSTTSRFASFVKGPREVLGYTAHFFTRPGPVTPGHNAMGGWSVLALLALLNLQVFTGLFAVDTDGLESGPLAALVSFSTGRSYARVHGLNFDLLLILVGLHVAVVLFYLLYKRQNLITPMFTGDKRLPPEASPPLQFASMGKALAGIVVAVVISVLIARA